MRWPSWGGSGTPLTCAASRPWSPHDDARIAAAASVAAASLASRHVDAARGMLQGPASCQFDDARPGERTLVARVHPPRGDRVGRTARRRGGAPPRTRADGRRLPRPSSRDRRPRAVGRRGGGRRGGVRAGRRRARRAALGAAGAGAAGSRRTSPRGGRRYARSGPHRERPSCARRGRPRACAARGTQARGPPRGCHRRVGDRGARGSASLPPPCRALRGRAVRGARASRHRGREARPVSPRRRSGLPRRRSRRPLPQTTPRGRFCRLAAEILSQDKSPAGQEFLRGRYERETDGTVRDAIAAAVSIRPPSKDSSRPSRAHSSRGPRNGEGAPG